MTTPEPPLSAPSASSQALPADQDGPAIPGFAWAYTVTYDGDTHWLECDHCSEPVKPVEAGDSLEAIVTRARDHERICQRPTAPAAASSVPTRACGWSIVDCRSRFAAPTGAVVACRKPGWHIVHSNMAIEPDEVTWLNGDDGVMIAPRPSVPTGTADCPSRFAARTGAVVGCRQRGRHLVHSNMAGATLDLVTWVDGDDDVIAISPGGPTGNGDHTDER